MSRAPAIPTPGRSSSSDRASSVSSSPRVTSTGSDSGASASARRLARGERGLLGQPGADERELQDLDRAGVHAPRMHSRVGRAPETAGLAGSISRQGRLRQGSAA